MLVITLNKFFITIFGKRNFAGKKTNFTSQVLTAEITVFPNNRQKVSHPGFEDFCCDFITSSEVRERNYESLKTLEWRSCYRIAVSDRPTCFSL